MCGINGKIYLNSKEIASNDIQKMNSCISHRGPDDEGTYISQDRKVGFGHRRLSIIDLSKKGHQPMAYKDRYVITYNGEIYNYKSEKQKLVRRGYKFKSTSDTEVLLALYDRYGVECLKYLRGFFAFAIYDKVKNTVFLARDRLGKKPLKYYFDRQVFCFASELKAILTQSEVHKFPDYDAINNYLTFGYVPAPSTGFENVYKLEPGHFMLLDIGKKTLAKHKYWSPDFSEKLNLSESEWKDKILDLLEESVKLRMIADVPVGAFLSGGVDSSAVVALMAKNSKEKIKTFTIGFKEEKYNETKYARKVAELFDTDHHEFVVEPENIEFLPELIRHYEEPYANSSNTVAYLVSKVAREHVKVVLNGDGADELFAGYDRYMRVKRDAYVDPYKNYLSTTGKLLLNFSKFSNNKLLSRSQKYFNKMNSDFSDKYLGYINFLSSQDKFKIFSKKFSNKINISSPLEILQSKFAEAGNVSLPDKALYFDLTTYFPDDLLTKVDIASMKVGLEARSPFVDHKLVELACKIPFNLKIKGIGSFKYILKKSLEEFVPTENLYRKKMGFSIPLDKWFTGDLNNYARSILLDKKTKSRNLFEPKYVKQMLDTHSVQNDFGNKLWALLTLELWFREYFE